MVGMDKKADKSAAIYDRPFIKRKRKIILAKDKINK